MQSSVGQVEIGNQYSIPSIIYNLCNRIKSEFGHMASTCTYVPLGSVFTWISSHFDLATRVMPCARCYLFYLLLN